MQFEFKFKYECMLGVPPYVQQASKHSRTQFYTYSFIPMFFDAKYCGGVPHGATKIFIKQTTKVQKRNLQSKRKGELYRPRELYKLPQLRSKKGGGGGQGNNNYMASSQSKITTLSASLMRRD
jgi:hypothetical protein